MENPFLRVSPLDLELAADLCQEIHFVALRRAARGLHSNPFPDEMVISTLRERALLQGPGAYILHPADIERIFQGVTLAAYRCIESLYCSREARSIPTVWRILKAMAGRANYPSIGYEAVWAICLYLEERRAEICNVTINQLETKWRLGQVMPNVRILEYGLPAYAPSIVCVVEEGSSRVLAFRVARAGEIDEAISLSIFDAIVSLRRPSVDGNGGLIWKSPKRIVSEIQLPESSRIACGDLGIQTSLNSADSVLSTEMRSGWWKDISRRVYTRQQLAMVFDNYLDKVHGYGPDRNQEQVNREFPDQKGYNTDPTLFFAALREFLPIRAGVIREDGLMESEGRRYAHELLDLWPGCPVTVRASENGDRTAWVYLDGEVLCQAKATGPRGRDESNHRSAHPR